MDEIEKSAGKSNGHNFVCEGCGGVLREVGSEQSNHEPDVRIQTLACETCQKVHIRRYPKQED